MVLLLLFAVCKALETGVSGLFGPQSGATAAHIQSMCDALELPHVETRWDSRDNNESPFALL